MNIPIYNQSSLGAPKCTRHRHSGSFSRTEKNFKMSSRLGSNSTRGGRGPGGHSRPDAENGGQQPTLLSSVILSVTTITSVTSGFV